MDTETFSRIQREVGRFLDGDWVQNCANAARSAAAAQPWQPRADTYSDEQSFHIVLDVPGVDPQQINVSVNQRVLTIAGSRSVSRGNHSADASADAHDAGAAGDDAGIGGARKVSGDDNHYRSQHAERPDGQFSRQFELPDNADESQINAHCEWGVLRVSVALTDTSVSGRTIPVNA